MESILKILVVDDNQNNRKAAEAQLSDYNLTVLGTYDEALKILGYLPYDIRIDKNHGFDVVLLDLLMPPGLKEVCPNDGSEQPVGMFLAILAAMNGAKHVGLLTDGGHHAHPMIAALESITDAAIKINRAIVRFQMTCLEDYNPIDMSTPLTYDQWDSPNKVRAKDWKSFLDELLETN